MAAIVDANSKIEEAILSYLAKRNSPFTFNELYEALNFSEQGIRNRVYLMIDEEVIERLKQKSPGKGNCPRSLFRLKPRSR